MFKVKLTNGNVITRHVDQIRDRQFADHEQPEQFEFFTSEITHLLQGKRTHNETDDRLNDLCTVKLKRGGMCYLIELDSL